MGNKVMKARRMAGVNTSVRIEIELYVMAQRKGINVSNVTNAALRALLKKDEEDLTDEQVATLWREQTAKVEKTVEKAVADADQEQEAALRELQTDWNQYVAADPTHSTSQKLAWIESKRGFLKFAGLKRLSNEAILIELQGTST
jgi:uncharacterized membrane protein YkoI